MKQGVTLAEVIPLMAQMEKTAASLRSQIQECSVVLVEKGGVPEPDQDVHALIDELDRISDHLRTLRLLCAKANQSTLIDYYDESGKQLTLAEALLLVKQLRSKLSLYQELALKPARPVRRPWGGEMFEVATFDPAVFRKQARSLERKVNRLSAEIDRANFTTMIEVDVSDYIDPLD